MRPPKLPRWWLPQWHWEGLVWDAVWLAGVAAAGYGVWQIYPPAAWIAVGGFFIALGLLGSASGPRASPGGDR